MTRAVYYPLIAVVVLCGWGCGDDDRRGGDDTGRVDTAGGCASNEDCDDGQACTIDSCGVGGMCRYDAIAERCEAGLFCEPFRGCVSEPSCTSDADCDDGASCTIDSCGVGGECQHNAVDELCESVGPGSRCAPDAGGMAGTGCTEATGCRTDADCDDMIDCTLDACTVEMTCSHTQLSELCEDGEICGPSGCFEMMMCDTDEDCDDGIFCNGRETCMPEFGCQPAAELRNCDDSDPCTIDSCDMAADMCVFACDSARAECECPMGETPCDGIFDVTPAPMQTCALGVIPETLMTFNQVDYNITEVEFACVGTILSVDARNVPNPMTPSALTQSPRADDGSFNVATFVEGECRERYGIEGRFIDDTTFEGTFTASYEPAGCERGPLVIPACASQSIPIRGVRR